MKIVLFLNNFYFKKKCFYGKSLLLKESLKLELIMQKIFL